MLPTFFEFPHSAYAKNVIANRRKPIHKTEINYANNT
jgi:hypothetical protein